MPPRSRWLRRLRSPDLAMSLLAEAKRADRAAALMRRAAAHAANPDAGAEAARHLLAAIEPGAEAIAGYLPIRDEIDPLPAMRALIDRGCRVGVPVIEAKGRPLRFRTWTPEAAIVPGAFGVMVPEAGDWLAPQALIVPLLAFDRFGHRLGYGGGFYDRTLAMLRRRAPVQAIGLAYAAQEVERLPIEETDARLDAIATEVGLVRPA